MALEWAKFYILNCYFNQELVVLSLTMILGPFYSIFDIKPEQDGKFKAISDCQVQGDEQC